MNHPVVIESTVIGHYCGEPMHAWSELFADGSVRQFEEYLCSVFCESLGRDVRLTMVREVTA